MKTITLSLALLGFVSSAVAAEKAELDHRIRTLTAKFEELQRQPDKRIPADTLRRARGIVLLDRTKAGFIFAYQGGSGVALVKDKQGETWGPVAFVSANEASLGFQVGGQQSFVAVLLMDVSAAQRLAQPNFAFGGEARGTAGDASAGAEGTLTSPGQSVLVYGDRKGLYGGAAIKGDVISPDNDANGVYYGRYLTMKDVLFDHKVKAGEAAADLARKLADASIKTPRYSEK